MQLKQYFRQMTPNVGQYDSEGISDACAALFNKIGPAVFVTHFPMSDMNNLQIADQMSKFLSEKKLN